MPKEELQNALYLELVNRVNEVGVDVNRCVAHPYTAPLVQFVCGLGPRKGYQLLKVGCYSNAYINLIVFFEVRVEVISVSTLSACVCSDSEAEFDAVGK